MFNGLDTTYSLVNVVAEHLKMLLDAGLKPKLLVSEDCPETSKYGVYLDPRIEWVKITNRLHGKIIHWRDYSQIDGYVHETFFDEAKVIAEDLKVKLTDVDVCIMHDIHFQGWHLVHNIAVRQAQKELPKVKFIAFTHSAPATPSKAQWPFSARYSPMPDTIYVYPTQTGLPALAKQYNVNLSKCGVINNTFDIIAEFSEDIKKVAQKTDLYCADILIVYPARLTPAKKFEKVAALGGALKKASGKKVKVIFCDFASLDIDPHTYKKFIKTEGCIHGLNEQDITFTSNLGYNKGFPRSSVIELFTVSNLFICPSFSESFGLTVLEAASRGNFIVLNEAVPALKELADQLHAYPMRWDARNFGFDTTEQYHPSEQAYLEEHAKKIIECMFNNPVIIAKSQIRQRYSPKWVWENQMLPLLQGKCY